MPQEPAEHGGPAEPAGPRVAAVLESLVLQNVTGVLRISGDPDGVIYLDHGQLTYAEASWAPGLAARLRVLVKTMPEIDQLGTDPGASLIDGQYLSRAGLRAVLKSMVIDALIVLTMPLPDETYVAGTRFEALEKHWAGTYSVQRLDSLRAVVVKKTAVLMRAKTGIISPLELRDLPHPWAIVKREQWEVASKVNGISSIRDLAAECGLPLHDTIERVASLLKKGMCAAGPAPTRPKVVVQEFPEVETRPDSLSVSDELREGNVLPPVSGNGCGVRRVSQNGSVTGGPVVGGSLAGGPLAAGDDSAEAKEAPPSAEQLRRVLDGLRRLS